MEDIDKVSEKGDDSDIDQDQEIDDVDDDQPNHDLLTLYKQGMIASLFGSFIPPPDVKSTLREYGHPEFSFDAYRRALKEVSMTAEIDQYLQVFLNLDEPLLEKIGTEQYKFPFCSNEWGEDDDDDDDDVVDDEDQAITLQIKERLAVIIEWIQEVSTQSYPLSHILAEEFTKQTLDPRSFDLQKPQPLPFLNTGGEEIDSQLTIPGLTTKVPIGIILQSLHLIPEYFNQAKLLLMAIIGNPLYKVVLCDEFLEYYKDLDADVDQDIENSYISCQMFELASIFVPFNTGYSKHNIILSILSLVKKYLEKRNSFNLDDSEEREAYDKYLTKLLDYHLLVRYFKNQQVTEYAFNNDVIINEYLKVLSDLQEIAPVRRQLTEALEFELPVLQSIVSPLKYITSILGYINSTNKQYFTFNNYLLPSNDIFNGVDTVSIHSPLNRLIGVLWMNMINASDYSQSAIKSLINNQQLISIFNLSILPIVLMSQSENRFWQKNLNIPDVATFQKWSFQPIDLFTLQYSSILLGPNYFLNVLISTFTSNYKSTKEYPHCLNDMLTLVIRVLQLRKSSMTSYEEVRYNVINSLIAKINTHSKIIATRKEFFLRLLDEELEKAIQEVSTPTATTETEKKLTLKSEYWDRYDYYYPYHLRITPESTLESYNEHIKSDNSTFPLPCKLDALHPNLLAVNQLFDEPLIYQIAFSTLLSFVHPSYQMKVKFESLSNFKDSEYFIPSPTNNQNELDQAANHILYLLSMAMRNFKESTMTTLHSDEVSNIRSTFKSYLLNDNSNNNQQMEKPISILNIVQPYQVIVDSTSNTIKPISIFDLVTDLFETIDSKNKFAGKKNLICNLLISVNEFDSSVNQYFTNRKMSIDEVVNIETEKEERIKKEESLKRQMMIKEKMMQQQLQFLQNNEQLDNEESNNNDTESDNIVCVSCKSSRNSSSDPLCAIGHFEGMGVTSTSKRQTFIKHYDRIGPDIEKEFSTLGGVMLAKELKDQNHHELLYLFQQNFPINIRICDHYIHQSCFESFSSIGTLFKCPLCNRVSSFILPTDNQSRNEYVQKIGLQQIVDFDITYDQVPKIEDQVVQKFLWKYPLVLIEIIEMTTRQLCYLNTDTDKPYYVFSEVEFQKRLKALRLFYFNIMTFVELENTEAFDPWSDSNAEYDPFILATYSHYLNNNNNNDDSSDLNILIRKAYERLIFYAYGSAIDRYIIEEPDKQKREESYEYILEKEILVTHLQSLHFLLFATGDTGIYQIPRALYFPCARSCSKFPKGVCLHCSRVVCYENCCDNELVNHNVDCQHGLALLMSVVEPQLSVNTNSGMKGKINIYFNKFGEASSKVKDNLTLNKAALKKLYFEPS
ncbi:hypothetical protein PPL_02309 [Heterostelium album PN500]|uniref:E3 ubiquitin-protein ligase n=1 Tax=Heterostelium pallidum (strain ATCC 26659 / Pp 5 / PN500) TaxID=670386 RepID=D3B1Y4_HETP5|nr:hypothetical protein PPL_02309 [Heterostelium album PN500]EFA85308.1 hypothetical protein PPL_02309 [Heterostelium album PN500]|eukprot:XP_020437417.1 hypothetical protein PPL_02309 [Heterostelium album PN500]